MTPTISSGSSRPTTESVCPTTAGSAPKWRRQLAWLSTMTDGAPVTSSDGLNVRPNAADTPSVSKNELDTTRCVSANGASARTSRSPQSVEPSAARLLNEDACARHCSK
jgi:hypothetical protein